MLSGAVSGLIPGAAYAVLATCVVLLYRLGGVVNFGLAATGALGAYSAYALLGMGWPLPAAVMVGVAAATAISGLSGWVLARWFGAPSPTARSVVAVVILVVVLTLGFRLFGDSPRVMPSLLPEFVLSIAGVRVSLSTLIAILFAVAVAAGLTALLRWTRLGTRLEAMADRPVTVQLLGINTRLLSTGAWSAAGGLAAVAMLCIAPTRNPTFEAMSFMIVPALAAALLGAFERVWVAALVGLVIGMLEGAGARIEWLANYRGAVPFVLIIVALIWLRRREVWDAAR